MRPIPNSEKPTLSDGLEAISDSINTSPYAAPTLGAFAIVSYIGLLESLQGVLAKKDSAYDVRSIMYGAIFTIALAGYYRWMESAMKSEYEPLVGREFNKSVYFEKIYEFIDDDGIIDTDTAPKPVSVIGKGNEDLGIGWIIGSLFFEEGIKGITIVELDEPYSHTGTVQLTENECIFSIIEPDEYEHMLNSVLNRPTYSAYNYARNLGNPVLES